MTGPRNNIKDSRYQTSSSVLNYRRGISFLSVSVCKETCSCPSGRAVELRRRGARSGLRESAIPKSRFSILVRYASPLLSLRRNRSPDQMLVAYQLIIKFGDDREKPALGKTEEIFNPRASELVSELCPTESFAKLRIKGYASLRALRIESAISVAPPRRMFDRYAGGRV
ncbi:hypothetical protein Bxe_C0960 [Paraburkholderia xenovorans LB400]|uniref:Uncharacterized protein n=1 Tax=Paraburkholderia xenovorans (strain LB400) TaxID=266265 RepID=Q13GF4_PARXL|nr:hypothetical protein Bxe_C0960 [Paraburkholderia xenovorans LB400]